METVKLKRLTLSQIGTPAFTAMLTCMSVDDQEAVGLRVLVAISTGQASG